MDYNLYMTIKDSLGLEVNSVLWRLNVLLQNGYSVNLRNGMVYYSESKTLEEGESSEVVSLIHTFKKELNLFLYPDGLIVQQKPLLIGEDNPDQIRIHEEETEKFLKFVSELPKVRFYHKIFSFYLRLR